MLNKIATGSGIDGNDLQELKKNSEKQDLYIYIFSFKGMKTVHLVNDKTVMSFLCLSLCQLYIIITEHS